jgi:tRNA dimethylallyltransferase
MSNTLAAAHSGNPQRIVVIAGPTAVGKTAGAVALARRFDGELVGADSVQVYRGFDIGSSKPTAAELGGMAHHLIDVCDASELIDAARYAELADAAIRDVAARGKLPIVVGGTGLWLRALLRGLVALPQVDRALRARLEAEWDAAGSGAMHERLSRVDPLSAQRIHAHDKLRVVRALEVFEQTGRPLGEARREHALGKPRYHAHSFVLDLPSEQHKLRVAARVREMISRGLVEEVRALLARYGPRSHVRALGSVGYRQIVEHLADGVSLAETELKIVRATLIYARRQRTWWSTDPSMHQRILPDALFEVERLAQLEAFVAGR